MQQTLLELDAVHETLIKRVKKKQRTILLLHESIEQEKRDLEEARRQVILVKELKGVDKQEVAKHLSHLRLVHTELSRDYEYHRVKRSSQESSERV